MGENGVGEGEKERGGRRRGSVGSRRLDRLSAGGKERESQRCVRGM